MALVELSAAESSRAAELERSLQAGEAACLAVAEARGGLVLTDDSAARRLAGALGLQISGTIGALARLIHRDVLSLAQADTLLAQMITRGYRSPVQSLREIPPFSA